MKSTEGHRSTAAWNVYLWLSNDDTLNGAAKFSVNEAIRKRSTLKSDFMRRRKIMPLAAGILLELIPARTPDGHRYTLKNIALALAAIFPDTV